MSEKRKAEFFRSINGWGFHFEGRRFSAEVDEQGLREFAKDFFKVVMVDADGKVDQSWIDFIYEQGKFAPREEAK